MSREVVVVSAVRTAIGTFGGSLKDIPPTDLAAQVVRESLSRATVEGRDVGHVVRHPHRCAATPDAARHPPDRRFRGRGRASGAGSRGGRGRCGPCRVESLRGGTIAP